MSKYWSSTSKELHNIYYLLGSKNRQIFRMISSISISNNWDMILHGSSSGPWSDFSLSILFCLCSLLSLGRLGKTGGMNMTLDSLSGRISPYYVPSFLISEMTHIKSLKSILLYKLVPPRSACLHLLMQLLYAEDGQNQMKWVSNATKTTFNQSLSDKHWNWWFRYLLLLWSFWHDLIWFFQRSLIVVHCNCSGFNFNLTLRPYVKMSKEMFIVKKHVKIRNIKDILIVLINYWANTIQQSMF